METFTIQHFTEEDAKLRRPPDAALWARCENDLSPQDVRRYVLPMRETLQQSGGVGLAANQVGLRIPLFLFLRVTEKGHNGIQSVYRPCVLERGGKEIMSREGCLSFPGLVRVVKRFMTLKVQYLDLENDKQITETLEGFSAIVFQHEYDHLQGLNIIWTGFPSLSLGDKK